jgi:hypothetical protein
MTDKRNPNRIDADAALNTTENLRAATGLMNFIPTKHIPGVNVIQGAAETGIAAAQGDYESIREEQRLEDAGVKADSNAAKWNPRIKSHMEKFRGRWAGRAGEAATSAVGGGVGGIAGGAAGGALIGGTVVPLLGAPVGAVIGGVAGSIGGTYVMNKAHNMVWPLDDKDDVDLTLKIVDAQKKGQQVPAEVIFAQWAAQQKGPIGNSLTAELKERTGYSNFNNAVEQGKMAELNVMMNNPKYEARMRSSIGMMPDLDNPARNVADQMAEWVNSGGLKSKDLLLGSTNLPNMSLAEAQRCGCSDVLTAPSLDPTIQKRQEQHHGMAL